MELYHKIMYEYDFMVVELDALAASKKPSGRSRKIVTNAVDKRFDNCIRDWILNWPEHSQESINAFIVDK